MKRLLLLTILLFSFAGISVAQTMNTNVNTNAKMKSLFIYKFAQATEWPAEYKQGDFIIGVVNDEDLAKYLEVAAATKNINSQKVVIKRIKSTAEVSKCHIIYVSGAAGEVEPYIAKAKQYKSLIIAGSSGLLEQSCFNFIVAGSILKFEINRKLCKDQGLVVSSSLENLAVRVIN